MGHNRFNPFPNNKFWTFPNWKSLQTNILNLIKMAESSVDGQETLWKKEKLLVMSNFSSSRIVFKRLVLQTRKNLGLFGKRLSEQRLNFKHFIIIRFSPDTRICLNEDFPFPLSCRLNICLTMLMFILIELWKHWKRHFLLFPQYFLPYQRK